MITKFERWMLQRIFNRTIIQGYHHKNLEIIFDILKKSMRNEFVEDTETSRIEFLKEYLDKGSKIK